MEFYSGGELETHNVNHTVADDDEQIEPEIEYESNEIASCESDKFVENPGSNEKRKQRRKHILSSNDKEKEFSCIICSAKFKKKSNLRWHMDIHIENRPINDCDICGKQVFDLRTHMKRTHSSEKPYQCTICPATFRKSLSMHEHVSFCEIVVFSAQDLTRHIAICSKSAPEIPLEENIQHNMQKRMQTASIQLRECVLCNSKVKNLKLHLRSHAQERPFPCPMCEKTFTQTGHRSPVYDLKRTGQVHNAESNLDDMEGKQPIVSVNSCEICSRNFDSISDLDDHMKNHITSGRLCEICAKIIAPGCITSHMRTHTTSKQNGNHKCNICPTSFRRKDHMEEYLKFHTKIRPYQCSYCTDAFYSSAANKTNR